MSMYEPCKPTWISDWSKSLPEQKVMALVCLWVSMYEHLVLFDIVKEQQEQT